MRKWFSIAGPMFVLACWSCGPAPADARVLPPITLIGAASAGNRHDALANVPADARAHDPRGRFEALQLEGSGDASARLSYALAIGYEQGPERVLVPIAYIQYRGLAGRHALNLRAGAFEAGPAYLTGQPRASLRRYLAPIELRARGVELNGVTAAWSYGLGVSRSHREFTDATRTTRLGPNLEDTYLWAARDLHGQRLGARMWFGRQDSDLGTLPWLQRLQLQTSAQLALGRLTLTPVYTLDRFDDRPGAGIHLRHQYVMLEGLAMFGSDQRWGVRARAEHEHRTRTVLTSGADHDLEAFEVLREFRPGVQCALGGTRAGNNVGEDRSFTLDALVRITR